MCYNVCMEKNARIERTLTDLGLNPKEITIYLALLTVGSSPASVLGQRTGILKSTTQYTCQQLTKKGLIRMVEKSGTYLYFPEPPQKIILLLQKQQEKLRKREEDAQLIIADLQAMVSPASVLPRVRFYEGKDAMIELYDSILDLRSPVDSIEEKGDLYRMFPEYSLDYVRKRVEWGIPNRCIAPSESPLNVSDPKKLLEVRHLNRGKFPLSCDIKICKNQVSIFSFEQNTAVGIAITHADIAQNFRLLFAYMWESLAQTTDNKKRGSQR